MNKREYLSALERELRTCYVMDPEDILEEYEEHFAMRLADGYTEEETAAKLAKPKEIAEQYANIKENKAGSRGKRTLIATGLITLDLFVVPLFIILFAWVFAIAVFSAASAILSILLLVKLDIAGLMPAMPYSGSVLLGIACLALAVLSALGTVYCYCVFVQMTKTYGHWHKGMMQSAGGIPYLPMLRHPLYSAKTRRRMRKLTLLTLVGFIVFFVAALSVLFIKAGFSAPWHTWNWFV